jgi:hypothetical protein
MTAALVFDDQVPIPVDAVHVETGPGGLIRALLPGVGILPMIWTHDLTIYADVWSDDGRWGT